MDPNDTEHIWLRQSVTFTVDGQTRTVEIGIPVPRNATAQEIEALLGVADAGTSALARRLDAHIVGALGGAEAHLSDNEVDGIEQPAPAPALPAASPPMVSANGHAPVAPEMPEMPEMLEASEAPASAPVPDHPVTHPSEAGAPTRQVNAGNAPAASAQPSRPAPAPHRSPAPQRPAEPPRPQTPAAPPAKQPSAATRTPDDTGGEMTRPQFIAAVAELGLNPRQAMDRLGVRSLEGLNLREALESLRRQLLGAASPVETEPEPEPESGFEPAPRSSVAEPPTPARYFEEEDDETILYALDEDDELIEDEFAPSAGSDSATPSVASDEMLDDLDLEDVPDLTPPPARQRSAPAARKPANSVRETPAPAAEVAASGASRAQAMQLIGRLRTATGGGPASDYQRTAYRNIVENELGKAQATALVRGLWRTTADRLTAAQLDALIRWGKEDVFADEAALVLGALRAEQRRTEQAEPSAKSAGEGPASRPAARGRSSGGSR